MINDRDNTLPENTIAELFGFESARTLTCNREIKHQHGCYVKDIFKYIF